VKPPKLERSFWLLLMTGVALRCLALNQPLLDAHLIRQCQTAATTQDLIEQSGFNLSSRIPWAGDLNVRHLEELPVYNYLVIGVYKVVGNLDASGKLTSIILWTASFFVLQFIWRRFLNSEQTFWANLLFVFAPLEVFYGQAFMPEMLVQFLAFAFVLLAICYHENPTLIRWIACAAVGLIGLLIKLPEFSHLYLILIALIFMHERARTLIRPRYLVAAALTIVTLKVWSNYLDAVNVDSLSFGSSKQNLQIFIGSWQSRFQFVPWAMICLYLVAFVLPGPIIFVAAWGFWTFLRRNRTKILGLWLLSLALFYLLWFGNTAANQSYYNLPAVAPLCALVGVGMTKLLSMPFFNQWRRTVIIIAPLLVVVPAIPVYRYLWRQDWQLFAACEWVRANTQPNDVILFRPNHSSSMIDYPYNPVMSYYGRRPTFVWTSYTPETYRQAALDRANFAVITVPQPPPAGLLGIVNRFRHFDRVAEPIEWLETNGFRIIVNQTDFLVYARDKVSLNNSMLRKDLWNRAKQMRFDY
jgi:4-amino-4-deoxy-L-arabinose transferase-like glycosyltransferase